MNRLDYWLNQARIAVADQGRIPMTIGTELMRAGYMGDINKLEERLMAARG